jgi:hypothetical protein
MHHEGGKLRSHNASYCLKEVVTKAGLIVYNKSVKQKVYNCHVYLLFELFSCSVSTQISFLV